VITAELRQAILAAVGPAGAEDGDPLLRPGPAPGSYASSLPFRLARPGQDPREVAAALASRLAGEPWIAVAEVTGRGFLTVTVTHDALAGLAVRIVQAGPACTQSDALRGCTVPAAPPGPMAAAPDWPQARVALAAQLTARLAAVAGATVFLYPERSSVPAPAPLPAAQPEGRSAAQPTAHPLAQPTAHPLAQPTAHPLAQPIAHPLAQPIAHPLAQPIAHPLAQPIAHPLAQPIAHLLAQPIALPEDGPVAAAARYAGADAVRFALARMPPGGSAGGPVGGAAPVAAVLAQHVLANPAYAVRYAHAAAAAVLRWAAALGTRPAGFTPRLLAEPGELALLDALSWLPERVAVAARRGRPDAFAGYLEELAARTIETMSTTSFTTVSSISSERLWLADAARAGLAAGLGLLGIDAPSRL
jgi:DALR anticodon binding protein/arginyl tRNA synthetase-like protein